MLLEADGGRMAAKMRVEFVENMEVAASKMRKTRHTKSGCPGRREQP